MSINDNGSPTSAEEFAESATYERFVVYTLKNIPEADLNSYLFAYLTVSNAAGSSKSLARISKVSGGNTFEIDTTAVSGCFLQGSIGGSSAIVMLDDPTTDGNIAQEEDLTFGANDTFGVFKYESGNNEHFQCFGADAFRKGAPFISRVSANNYVKVPVAGEYDLYLKDNKVTLLVPNDAKSNATYYLNPGVWTADSARFAAYFFNNDAGINTWVNMTSAGNGYYKVEKPSGNYVNVIFCRMNPGTNDNNFNNGVKWNQTGDLSFDDNGNTYKVNDWDSYEWTTYFE